MNLQATKEMLIEASEAIVYFFCRVLDQLGDLTNILGMIGIALLTIFIPVAIGVFKDSKDFELLDKNVILDEVVKAHYFLIYLILIFFPLLLWGISSPFFRFLELIVWGIGIYGISKSLINSYNWIKGNKFPLRFDYFEKMKNIKDMEESWVSVWQTKNINPDNEKDFFNIFFVTINKLLQSKNNEDIDKLTKLLDDFNNFIDNRSILFLVGIEENFTKILILHFDVWKKRDTSPSHKEIERIIFHRILIAINVTLKKIEERALKEGEGYSFFKVFNQHVENNKDNKYYIKFLMNVFYQEFFEKIDTFQKIREIVKCFFPEEWKITMKNFSNENYCFARMSWVNFQSWADSKIFIRNINDIDHTLNAVVPELFPDVDPILWAEILTFLIRPYQSNNRMKNFIEGGINFGFMGRVIFNMGDVDDSARFKMEEKETLDLAMLLFKNKFTKVRLERYIDELEKLKYGDNTGEEETRTRFIYIFNKMKEEYN